MNDVKKIKEMFEERKLKERIAELEKENEMMRLLLLSFLSKNVKGY